MKRFLQSEPGVPVTQFWDNIYLPPDYVERLLALTHTERARYLHGEWNVIVDDNVVIPLKD